MKQKFPLLFIVLAGCSTQQSSRVIQLIEEPPRPAAVAKPWSDGQVSTYWIGRTTTGRDGNVIHETHPVYRLEGAGQPQLATYYLSDPPLAATNATFEQYESLRAEAARARDVTLKLTHAAEDLARQTSQLQYSAETNRLLQIQFGQVLDSAATLSNRVQQLEKRLTLPARATPTRVLPAPDHQLPASEIQP